MDSLSAWHQISGSQPHPVATLQPVLRVRVPPCQEVKGGIPAIKPRQGAPLLVTQARLPLKRKSCARAHWLCYTCVGLSAHSGLGCPIFLNIHRPSRPPRTFPRNHSEATAAVTSVSTKPGLLSGHVCACMCVCTHGHTHTSSHTVHSGTACCCGLSRHHRATPVTSAYFRLGRARRLCTVRGTGLRPSRSKTSSSVLVAAGFTVSLKK